MSHVFVKSNTVILL